MTFQGNVFDGTHVMEMDEEHFEAWCLKVRRGIGGHASATLMGATQSTVRDLFDGLFNLGEKRKVEPYMLRGSALEDDALDFLVDKTGMVLHREDDDLWIRNENRRLTGKVDAYVEADGSVIPESRGRGIVEVKCPTSWGWPQYRDGGIPWNNQLQANWYMGLTGCKWTVFCIFHGEEWRMLGNTEPPVMEFEEQLFTQQMERAEWFLREHFHTRIRPAAEAVVEELDPLVLGVEEVTLTERGDVNLVDRYFAVREEMALAKHQLDLLREQVEGMMGRLDTEVVKISDGRRISWKGSQRRTFKRGLLADAHPGIDLAPFFETKFVRSFRATTGA